MMIPAGQWTIAAPRARQRSCRELGPGTVPYSMVWVASCGCVRGSRYILADAENMNMRRGDSGVVVRMDGPRLDVATRASGSIA